MECADTVAVSLPNLCCSFLPLLPARFLMQYSLMIDTGSSNTGILGYDEPTVGASYQR